MKNHRTAPDRCFSGGQLGHGPIEPMDYPRARISLLPGALAIAALVAAVGWVVG